MDSFTLQWSEELDSGWPEIDEEHRHFIVLAKGLMKSIVDRTELPEIRKNLQLLLKASLLHFEHEETFLRGQGYPEFALHALKHRSISQRIDEILESAHDHATMYQWIDAALSIEKMLVEHLLLADSIYRPYLRALVPLSEFRGSCDTVTNQSEWPAMAQGERCGERSNQE